MDRLAVSVSEGQLHEVAAPETFETSGPFVVAVSNRGRDAHVHLRLDETLSEVATLAETNPHVPAAETVEVVADVDAVSAPVGGALTVETGYGADGAAVEVRIDPPAATRAGHGTATSDGGTRGAGAVSDAGTGATDEGAADAALTERVTPATLAVGLLAVGAVGVAVGTAALVADPVVVVGAAVAVLAAGVAALLLVR